VQEKGRIKNDCWRRGEQEKQSNGSEKDLRDWIKGARGIPGAKRKTSFVLHV